MHITHICRHYHHTVVLHQALREGGGKSPLVDPIIPSLNPLPRSLLPSPDLCLIYTYIYIYILIYTQHTPVFARTPCHMGRAPVSGTEGGRRTPERYMRLRSSNSRCPERMVDSTVRHSIAQRRGETGSQKWSGAWR